MDGEADNGGAHLLVNGAAVPCRPGEPVAAALIAAGIRRLWASPAGAPSGAFCMAGACQGCLARVDGNWRETCLVAARDGMEIVLGESP